MFNLISIPGFIASIILSLLVLYLPGRWLLRLTGYKFDSFVITFSSSLVIGIASFLFVTYLLAWIKLDYLYNLILLPVLFFEFKPSVTELRQQLKLKYIISWEALIIILGSCLMAYLTWQSGSYQNGNILFYGVNGQDSIYHLALIGSLLSNFPPFHPGLAGIPLRGYNFFYDFIIAEFAKFYGLNILDLFFRFFPLLISICYGLSSLAVSKFLRWNRRTSLIFLILIYFAQNFDFWGEHLYRFFNFYYNSAGITQSLQNILDPSVVFSASFIFIAFILLFSRKTAWSVLILSLVIGLIPQIKIYSGVIVYAGLGIISITELFKNKNPSYFITLILSGIISAIVYLPVNSGAGGLVYAPLLIFKNFIDSAWLFNNWHWNVNFPIYVQAHNYIHIALFYLVAIFIFISTSLGVRLFIFIGVGKILKKDFYSTRNIFLATLIITSFFIPSFFVQSVSAFSIIQFFWIGYLVILLPTAAQLGEVAARLNKMWLFIVACGFFVILLPGNILLLTAYSVNPGIIAKGLVQQTQVLRNVPQKDGVILANRIKIKNKRTGVYEYVDVSNVPVISALSGHQIYYEHELTQFQGLGEIPSNRIANVQKIEDNLTNCKNPELSEDNIISIMGKTNNKYLLILQNIPCSGQFKKLKLIHEEKDSIIYSI